jgi:hypothetical protein
MDGQIMRDRERIRESYPRTRRERPLDRLADLVERFRLQFAWLRRRI